MTQHEAKLTPGHADQLERERQRKLARDRLRKREAKIQATNEAILAIFEGINYDQAELSTLLDALAAMGHTAWFLEWIREKVNVIIQCPREQEHEYELEWL